MPVRYENPREVGADRIVNSVAAYEMFGGPIIAVDFGTATTFDCISQQGEYLGGVICPGIHISMEALFDRASMLHRVEIARPRSVIGRTTTASLQSGLLFGYAGLVDSMVGRIRRELGEESRVIATGYSANRLEMCKAVPSPSTVGLVAMITSLNWPVRTRSTSGSMVSCSGPIPSNGAIRPSNTW